MKVYVRDPDTDKLPWGPLLTVISISFLDGFCMLLIAPNLAFMVRWYYPELDETEVGYYSGYLTAVYNIGGIPGSLFWGWYSDRFGRRMCFITSLSLIFICVNLFGLAPTYPIALTIRCIWGFVNGNVGATKTYISEICNSKTQSMGFSLFIAAFGIASAMGPTIGGILSKPEENLQWLLRLIPELANIPFYIPCFVGGVLVFCILIATIFILPETLSKEAIKDKYAKKDKVKESIEAVQKKREENPDYQETLEEIELKLWAKDNYCYLFTNKQVLQTALLYGLVSMIQLAQDNIYPIWLLMSKAMLLPLFSKLMNYTDIYCVFSILYGVILCLNPILGTLSYADTVIQWYMAVILYSLSICMRLLNFGSVIVLITNATYFNFRSKVNGIGQVAQAVGRSLGPIISSNLFAWTVSADAPPFINYGFSFYLIGAMSILSGFVAYVLPKSINHPSDTIQEAALAEYNLRFKDIEMQELSKEPESITTKESPDEVVVTSDEIKKEDEPVVANSELTPSISQRNSQVLDNATPDSQTLSVSPSV